MADFSNELLLCPRHGILSVMWGSKTISDSDDTNIRISDGRKCLVGKVEGSASSAAVGAPINNFDGDGSTSAAPITLALNSELLATVVPIIPYVGTGAVASSCDEHVIWELALVVAKTGRGYN